MKISSIIRTETSVETQRVCGGIISYYHYTTHAGHDDAAPLIIRLQALSTAPLPLADSYMYRGTCYLQSLESGNYTYMDVSAYSCKQECYVGSRIQVTLVEDKLLDNNDRGAIAKRVTS